MKYQVVLSREGRATIEEQIEWYGADDRHGGADLASRWLDKLHSALAGLSEMPARHGFAPENKKWHSETEIRQMLFRPWKSGVGWRVLFAIDEASRIVTILQIRHEHRPWISDAATEEE